MGVTTNGDGVSADAHERYDELAGELAAVRAEHAAAVAQLELELEKLRSERHAEGAARRRTRRPWTRRASLAEAEPQPLMSRRRLFGLLGGAAAAGGLAAAGSVLAAEPAGATAVTTGAADGDAFQLGGVNKCTSTTSVEASSGLAGLLGISDGSDGFGVEGICSNGTSAIGVWGVSGTGYGLVGSGQGLAPIRLESSFSIVGAPSSGTHVHGELFVDKNSALFFCTANGTPGTWVNLSTGSKLVTIAAARIYDSRPGNLPNTGPKTPITNGTIVNLNVTNNSSGVPATASAVLGNLTVTNTAGPGFLTVWKQGASQPATSNINWVAGQTIANNFTSQVNTSNSEISVTLGGPGPTDFLVDIVGYYP